MPDVTLANLTVGKQDFTIRFWRDGADTRHDVLFGDAGMVEVRPFGAAWTTPGR